MDNNVTPRHTFYVMIKDFKSSKVSYYDIMPLLYKAIFNTKKSFSKSFYLIGSNGKVEITTKDLFTKFIDIELKYYFWSRCQYEFIVIDWPYSKTIEDSNPVKVDVYQQLKPNIPIIVDLLWQDVSPLLKK